MKLAKILLGAAAFTISLTAFAAKPKIMVLPETAWAVAKGYGENIDAQGKKRFVVNYDQCFADPDFKNAVTVIESLMQDEDFPLVNYESQSASNAEDDAASAMYTSKKSGGSTQRTGYDELMARFKPDIALELGWDKKQQGFDYSVSFRLNGKDSYSNKAVATIVGPSPVVDGSTSVGDLLQAVINSKMSEFTAKLARHFTDLENNGREIAITMEILDTCSEDFDYEVGDESLSEIIYNWLSENTVNGSFSEANSSPNVLKYDQVRIPLEDKPGRKIQAKQFVEKLRKYLKNTHGIDCENRSSGLGKGYLYFSNL